jgi:hypothetical protein
MLTLPAPPRRGLLLGFWISISLFIGLLIALVHWLVAIITVAALLLVGCCCPALLAFAYRAWNYVARRFSRIATALLTSICFFVVITVVGRSGKRLPLTLAAGTGSLWVKRGQIPSNAYFAQHNGTTPPNGTGSAFFMWAIRSNNTWAVSLLPFLAVLSALAEEDEKHVAANIYTLF